MGSPQPLVGIIMGSKSDWETMQHSAQTLEKLGSMSFWKIAMKPGRPLTFGQLDEAVFFGLPGNPALQLLVSFFHCIGLKRGRFLKVL